jgi:phosphatidylglycerophosphatase C
VSLVFFDFDGTLTTRDTIWPFGVFLIRRAHRNSYAKAARLLFLLGCLKVRALSNHQFKERFCSLLLRGRSEQEIERFAKLFADSVVRIALNQPLVDALQQHQRSGDDVYLLSSNFSLVLRPWQETWAVRGMLATEAEIENGRFTGRLVGRACDGREKLARALSVVGRESLEQATAYGDSRSDRYIMEFVKKAIWV